MATCLAVACFLLFATSPGRKLLKHLLLGKLTLVPAAIGGARFAID